MKPTPLSVISAFLAALLSPLAHADAINPLGSSVERQLPPDVPLTVWTRDAERLTTTAGDSLELVEVSEMSPATRKLEGIVPPIYFDSGVATVPAATIATLRAALDNLDGRTNVRLHLVGHADTQPLSRALAARYGDNEGLSRERAGEVAELFHRTLQLTPGAMSYEWRGATQPADSNVTSDGRARNRRVEVEIWYDVLEEDTVHKSVVVSTDVPQTKICRSTTVCKLTYMDGYERRTRVRHMVPSMGYEDASLEPDPIFLQQIAEALEGLADKRELVVRFVGHTDDRPLAPRERRIYGDHEALSKARAQRVALAVAERLGLSTRSVESAGLGASRPVAANDTPIGRARNRRIDVEFWYDDDLQTLADSLQLCPGPLTEATVTRLHHPTAGELPLVPWVEGKPKLSSDTLAAVDQALHEVSNRTRARVRFVGFVGNSTLERRTADVYGDDVGLAGARAESTMREVARALQLNDAQTEFEGRGYLHADDVVNDGFVQGEESFIRLEVVYDATVQNDEYAGVDILPVTRELEPAHPLSLNLMRITIDGEPVDDPRRGSADVQRCTDVALRAADINMAYGALQGSPRLDVAASVRALDVAGSPNPELRFRVYSNYHAFIRAAEVRVFTADASLQTPPVTIVPVDERGMAVWPVDAQAYPAPVTELKYVVRVYDNEGRFDESRAHALWLTRTGASALPQIELAFIDAAAQISDIRSDTEPRAGVIDPSPFETPDATLAAYGLDARSIGNIPLPDTTVRVQGAGVPPDTRVWFAGNEIPVAPDGRFVAESLMDPGHHSVEVAVLDPSGEGELYLRDLTLPDRNWFYTGMADVTWSHNSGGSQASEFVGDDAQYGYDDSLTGRLSFFASGRVLDGWNVTAQADTREEEFDQLFSNVLDKEPDALFRRLDSDHHYPTFGDDSQVTELAPSQGKLYGRIGKDLTHALWGNYRVAYNQNELARVDRAMYGANGRWTSSRSTHFGERRASLDLFGAQPGTVPTVQTFRGTGGSFYYLRHQDLAGGSERVRIELRDKASGLVIGVVNLAPGTDYDVDYLQGTIMLAEPLNSTVSDSLLVRSGSLSGDEAYLVVRYEYTPGFDDTDAMVLGGQAHYWLTDYLKVGVTANENSDGGDAASALGDSSLQAADATLRLTSSTWLKLQQGRSEGVQAPSLYSQDGGFGFAATDFAALDDASALRADLSIGLDDLNERLDGRFSLYNQSLDAGYSGAGMHAPFDTTVTGGELQLNFGERTGLRLKSDVLEQTQGADTEAHEVNLALGLGRHWTLESGVRQDAYTNESTLLAPGFVNSGERTDAVVQLGYAADARWNAYGFVQETLEHSDDRESNGRVGLGGQYLVSDRLRVDAEVSDGELGAGGRVGTRYLHTERTQFYLNYALENERSDLGLRPGRQGEGNLVAGAKTRLSDSTSVYVEERYLHGQSAGGLTHATGVRFAPTQRLNVSAGSDIGTLRDRITGTRTDRVAGTLRMGYGFDRLSLSSGIEYRDDDVKQPGVDTVERRSWLFRNAVRWQFTDATRLLGKFNYATSDSTAGAFFDGEYTESVVGFAYRPVHNDRLNALVKYTYFYNLPSSAQQTTRSAAVQWLQKSHVASADVSYDLTPRLRVGGKVARRFGQVSLERDDPLWFDNAANLFVVRADWRWREHWELLLEGRLLDMPDIQEQRTGSLVALSRRLGDHVKLGLGYNFTDFSDDLTDLAFDHRGAFLNFTGAF